MFDAQPRELSPKILLHKTLAGWSKARGYRSIHASDLTKTDADKVFCPRNVALLDKHDIKLNDEFIGTALRATFDVGNAYHDLVRSKWLRSFIVGSWSCPNCDALYGFEKNITICIGCGCPRLDYVEEVFFTDYGVSGSIDMLLDNGRDTYSIVEIKSIDKDAFKTLEAPLAEHKWRTNLYLRIISDSSHPNKDKINQQKGYILYCCKGYGFKDDEAGGYGITDTSFSPFKCFEVIRNDEETESLIQHAKDIQEYKLTKVVPAGVCDTPDCVRAKKCNTKNECFV